MEDGSCCGIWGLTAPDCPHLERCEACYAPSRFGHEGYRAYFNDKEWDFAQTVGTFWTNVAGSGDPNCRDSPICGTRLWPKFESGEVTQQLGCTYIDYRRRCKAGFQSSRQEFNMFRYVPKSVKLHPNQGCHDCRSKKHMAGTCMPHDSQKSATKPLLLPLPMISNQTTRTTIVLRYFKYTKHYQTMNRF